MNNATALHELNRALAQFRRRQDSAPASHSAREIAQMSMLAEYLYISHTVIQCESETTDGQNELFHHEAV